MRAQEGHIPSRALAGRAGDVPSTGYPKGRAAARPTPKQMEWLRFLATWGMGSPQSGHVSMNMAETCRRRGWTRYLGLVVNERAYALTDAGRAALAGAER